MCNRARRVGRFGKVDSGFLKFSLSGLIATTSQAMTAMSATVQPTRFLLQRILVVIDQVVLPPQSCWNVEVKSGHAVALRAHKPGSLKLNGLFDIFPESYWANFTTLRSVSLCCRVEGLITLRIFRRYSTEGRETCVREWHSTNHAAEIDVALNIDLADCDAQESYLVVEVTSKSTSASLKDMAWETNEVPKSQPRLGVAITTYNRESFLVANLARLDGRLAGARLIVVNHGRPGLQERLSQQLAADFDFRCIDQDNKGGAGGFTRGMVEHHAAGDISHVLLMDDDIDLPEDLVERLTAILSFLHPDICLGGAMFDYHRRSELFSAGDALLPGSFGLKHIIPPDGCNISQPSGVDFLTRIHRPDFNGWWCFAFPVAALDEVGLPMPCFIRGDDVEFGYRLKGAGKPTVGWPGLAVWHLPFAEKASPWHMFYDRRNSLFTNARYRRIGRLAAFRKLHGGFAHHLLRYDYERVHAMTLGIAAFSQGPEAMAEWDYHDHGALIAATTFSVADHTALRGGTQLHPRKIIGSLRPLRLASRFWLDLLFPWRARVPLSLPPGVIWRPDFDQRPAVVIERGQDGYPVRLYQYSWRKSCMAMVRYVPAIIGMLLRFHQKVPLSWPLNRELKDP